jgi:hypothetical protein
MNAAIKSCSGAVFYTGTVLSVCCRGTTDVPSSPAPRTAAIKESQRPSRMLAFPFRGCGGIPAPREIQYARMS